MTPDPDPAPSAAAAGPARLPPEWEEWNDERLLDLRMCDLDLRIRGSGLEPSSARCGASCAERGLRFRPHFWLSDEWFCPDGVPGVAIPFYLAHPRLARLEQSQMLEVEGGTPEWCLRILRHEVGHAVENAYGLRRLRRRQRALRPLLAEVPRVLHAQALQQELRAAPRPWYAQSHPDEDFAETFAVWLTPGSDWARRYPGWKALQKLEYVDALMKEIAGPAAARSRTGARCEPLALAEEDPARALRAAARPLRGRTSPTSTTAT